MDIDLEELATVVELLKGAEFSDFRYEKGDMRLVISRGGPPASEGVALAREVVKPAQTRPAVVSAPTAQPAKPQATAPLTAAPDGADLVKAPLLGTFYASPKPGEAPFVCVGDRVEAKTVLCIVEVMKLMNSVEAGRAGVVVAIHAEDGQLVEHGQPLFSIAAGDA